MSSTERSRLCRQRKLDGELLPECGNCGRRVQGKLSKERLICSHCWKKTEEGRSESLECVRKHKAKRKKGDRSPLSVSENIKLKGKRPMETKRQSLNTLLDWQLSLVVKLHRGMANHDITKESCLSGDLLNALLGVEALTNAIAALPLEDKTQNRDRASSKFIEQSSVQETLNGWQSASDKIPLNREPTHSFDDDDAGW